MGQGSSVIELTLIYIIITEGRVDWILQTNPVVFGETVVLFCNTTSAQTCSECSLKWYGGQGLKLLTYDEISRNKFKYSSKRQIDGYSLEIKKINEGDVSFEYSCSFGFEIDKKMLNIGDTYELLPNNDTLNVSLSNETHLRLNVVVEFKRVHPKPQCLCKHNNQDCSKRMKMNSTIIGLFYQVKFELKVQVAANICATKLQLTCSVGSHNYEVVKKEISQKCKNEHQQFRKTAFLALILCAPYIVVVLLTFDVCCKSKTPKCKRQNLPADTHESIELDKIN